MHRQSSHQKRLESSLLLLLDKQERAIRRKNWEALEVLYRDIGAIIQEWSDIPEHQRQPSHPDLVKAIAALDSLSVRLGDDLKQMSSERLTLGKARIRLRGIRKDRRSRLPGTKLTVQA